MRIACRCSSSPRAIWPCWGVVFLVFCFFFYFSQPGRRADRASGDTHINALTHGQPHAQRTPPPSTPHTFLILLPILMTSAFCSLLFPFSLSVCSSLPFFNILFLSLHYRCSRLLLAAPTFTSPPPPPLSLSLPPLPSLSRSLSLHLLSPLSLSRFSVCV